VAGALFDYLKRKDGKRMIKCSFSRGAKISIIFKKIYMLLLVLIIVLIVIPSCNSIETGSFPEDYIQGAGMTILLSPVPKLGETAELTFIAAAHNAPTLKNFSNTRVWVEFYYANTRGSYLEAKYADLVPLEEVLVSGKLSWKGNATKDGFPELHATVQLPREGIWIIVGFVRCKGWEQPVGQTRFFAITEDATADIYGINGNIVDFNKFKSGPLGYLANFDYGWFGKRVPDEYDPVVLELDISKAPGVGEEAVLTCHINSIIDYEDYSAEFGFGKRGNDYRIDFMTGESLLVDGDLSWEGDLEKDESVEFSATIKFPEEGDWMAEVLGDNPTSTGSLLRDTIEMAIGDERGYFGWEERPFEPGPEEPLEIVEMWTYDSPPHQTSPVTVILIGTDCRMSQPEEFGLGVQLEAEEVGVISLVPLTISVAEAADDILFPPGGVAYRANVHGPGEEPWPPVPEKTVVLERP
jgi:hypothetical protein